MNNSLKKGIVSLALVGSFVIAGGTLSDASAQSRRNPRRPNPNGPVDSNGNVDQNRNGIDDRYEAKGQVDINQNGVPDRREEWQDWRSERGNRVQERETLRELRQLDRQRQLRYRNWRGQRMVGYYDRQGQFHAYGYYDRNNQFWRYQR